MSIAVGAFGPVAWKNDFCDQNSGALHLKEESTTDGTVTSISQLIVSKIHRILVNLDFDAALADDWLYVIHGRSCQLGVPSELTRSTPVHGS